MQAQKLNTAAMAPQTKAASMSPAASRKLKQVPARVSINADHKVSTASQKSKYGGFSFAGIAG